MSSFAELNAGFLHTVILKYKLPTIICISVVSHSFSFRSVVTLSTVNVEIALFYKAMTDQKCLFVLFGSRVEPEPEFSVGVAYRLKLLC
jgi:hypothetical protein